MFKRIQDLAGPVHPQVDADSRLLPLRGMIFLLLAAFLVLAACNRVGVESADSSPAGSAPSITILSPHPNDVLTENDLIVKVQIENFIMDPEAIGKAKVAGRGHWHLYLDGELVAPTAQMEFDLESITSGPHHVRAALANNDHSLLLPAIEDSVIIDVKSSAAENLSAPDDYEEAYGNHSPIDEQSAHLVSSSPTHGEVLYATPEPTVESADGPANGYSEEGY